MHWGAFGQLVCYLSQWCCALFMQEFLANQNSVSVVSVFPKNAITRPILNQLTRSLVHLNAHYVRDHRGVSNQYGYIAKNAKMKDLGLQLYGE